MTGTALHEAADTIRDLAAQMLTAASQLEHAANAAPAALSVMHCTGLLGAAGAPVVAAAHTYTAACDGLHPPGPCPAGRGEDQEQP